MTEKTITCTGWNGDQILTEDEFVKVWVDELNQLRRLNYSSKWQDRVDAMQAEVRNEAKREFIRVHGQQYSGV